MRLSVVIPCHNEQAECSATVQSIRETAGDAPEVIVVDDASPVPIASPEASGVVRMGVRKGVGPARHAGLIKAQGDWVLLTDAHMRFPQGWYEAALARLEQSPADHIWCASCVAIDDHHPLEKPIKVYRGAARWNLNGVDPQNGLRKQVFEINWGRGKLEDGAEIEAIMGACYFIPREWYLKHQGLQHLQLWGGDEQLLSLKAWLSGGALRYMDVQIGHKFWSRSLRPFCVPRFYPEYNKLFLMHTLLPEDLATKLEALMPVCPVKTAAVSMLEKNWYALQSERTLCARLLPRSFEWLVKRFNLGGVKRYLKIEET